MTPEETHAARGCLIRLALCALGALVLALAWLGWWLQAMSALGILLVIGALLSEREPEEAGSVSADWVEKHR